MSAPKSDAATEMAERIYDGIDKTYTLIGLLRLGAKRTFDSSVEADGFRNGVELVADIIEKKLAPLLETASVLCRAAHAKVQS